MDKETTTKQHQADVRASPSVRQVYVDRSKQAGRTGWAWVEHAPGLIGPVASEQGHLRATEVFDAEVVTINKAVQKAARGRPTPTRVYSDNLAAVESCKHRPAPSSEPLCVSLRGCGNLLQIHSSSGFQTLLFQRFWPKARTPFLLTYPCSRWNQRIQKHLLCLPWSASAVASM